MKKRLFLLTLVLTLSVGASAQGLLGGLLGGVQQATSGSKAGGIVNSITDVVYAYTGEANPVCLPGKWNYNGVALGLKGDGALSDIVGKASTSMLENKVDGYLQKVGIRQGAVRFEFRDDLTFSCTIAGIPLSGTWRTMDEGRVVELKFGKLLKFFTLRGSLKSTANGCKILFHTKNFFKFIKKVASVVGKASPKVSGITGLLNKYDGLKVGFELRREGSPLGGGQAGDIVGGAINSLLGQ